MTAICSITVHRNTKNYFVRVIIYLIIILILQACAVPQKTTDDQENNSYAPCIYTGKSYSSKDVQWLKANLLPIDLSTLSDKGLPIHLFTNTDIVGIGEADHGTHEFYVFKIELTKYLIEHEDFRIIAFELPMPYILNLNDFIHGNGGEPRDLLSHMGAWEMNSEEIFNFLVWLREFNKLAGDGQEITITGFDIPMGDPSSEINIIRKFLGTVDPVNQKKMVSQLSCINMDQSLYRLKSEAEQKKCRDSINNLIYSLQSNNSHYLELSSAYQYELAIKSLNSLLQLEHFLVSSANMAYPLRDQYMKENVVWIHDVLGKGEQRIVLWGHNSHIGRNIYGQTNSGTMGFLLGNSYEEKYFAIGSTFNNGDFNALPLTDIHKSDTPPNDSYETYFNAASTPFFFILIDQQSIPTWFSNVHCLRSIGAIYDNNKPQAGWDVDKLKGEYDGFFYVETSTPTNLFERR